MIRNWIIEHLYRKRITAIIFNDKNEFLIVQPVSYSKNDWNFSGGGIENGETEEEALLREIKEEVDIDALELVGAKDKPSADLERQEGKGRIELNGDNLRLPP